MEKARLVEILNEFSNKKIAVLGDMMLDEYIIGTVDRISPEAPVPVVNVEKESFVLGGAANVINNLCALKARAFSFGLIGQDKNGEKLKKELLEKEVNIEGIIEDETRPTIVKQRVIAHNQQLLRLDWEKKHIIEKEKEEILYKNIESQIKDLDAIILSDYDKGVLSESLAKRIIDLANKNNKLVTVDPKPKNSKNYLSASSMTPNRKEAIECLGVEAPQTEEEFIKMGKDLKEKLNLKNLLITRSEKGMTLFEDESIENIPTFAKEVFDVTGAGDTVITVFTLAAVSGASFYEAAKIANTAAGIVVGRMGTSTATKEEIIDFYERLYK